jgi:GAF domain-containing protein
MAMIISPDWMTLRDIAHGVDSPDPIRRQEALLRALRIIEDTLPDVKGVRLYRLDGQTVIVRAATDLPERQAKPLSTLPSLTESLEIEDGHSLWLPEKQQWVGCWRLNGQIQGFLEVIVNNLDDEWVVWLEVILTELGAALLLAEREAPSALVNTPSLEIKRRADRLIAASRMLLSASDYDEITTAARYAIPTECHSLLVTLFSLPISIHDSGAEGVANNRRQTVGYATDQHAEATAPDSAVSPMPDFAYLNSLRQQLPQVIAVGDGDGGYVAGWLRQYVTEQRIRQIIVIPMIASERVVGVMELLFKDVHAVQADELDLYTVLAEETAAVMLSKRLLRESLEAQAFASQLVHTNKAIAESDSYEEMAQAVLSDAPETIYAIGIALFNRPFTMMGTPVNLRTRALVTRDAVLEGGQVDYFSATEDARVTYFLHQYLEGRMMLLWSQDRTRKPVLAHTLVDALAQEEVNIITSFGLVVNSGLRGILVFAGDDDLRNPGPQYDGLRAIADQLAAVIENRILLQQTSEALDLIQTQYETTSRIHRTTSPAEILKAAYDFAGGDFTYAQVVTTDPDGVMYILAEVENNEAILVTRPVTLDDYPASATLAVLEFLEVRDVNDDAFLSTEESAALKARNIGAVLILPILNNFEVSGLVMFTSPVPTRLAPDRLRGLRSLTDQISVVLENRRLLQRTEQNLNEIQLLYEANRAMLRTQNALDVLRVLKYNVAPDAFVICQLKVDYSEDLRRISDVRLEYEIRGFAESSPNQRLNSNITELANYRKFLELMTESILFAPKGAAGAVPNNPVNLLTERYVIESYAVILVREQDRVVNLLYMLFDSPKQFLDSTRRLYEAIADQAAIAIENQKLLAETQESAVKLTTQVRALQNISELAVQINTMRDETALLKLAARVLVESVGVDHVGVILFNEDMKTGVLTAEAPTEHYLGITLDVGDNPLFSLDYQRGEVFTSSDVEHDEALSPMLKTILGSSNIRAIMIIPLIGIGGELFGSVGLDIYENPRNFDATEIRTAKTIAAQIAVGMQNVRLLRDAEERALQLQRINDFSQTTQTTLETEPLIETILANAARLLPMQHIALALLDAAENRLVLRGGWEEQNGIRHRLITGAPVPYGNTTGYVFEGGGISVPTRHGKKPVPVPTLH